MLQIVKFTHFCFLLSEKDSFISETRFQVSEKEGETCVQVLVKNTSIRTRQ